MRAKKRGFTLLELTIVMAVTAIMAAGIVTFCVTVKNISDNTRNTNNALNDVANIRQTVANWISYFDAEDYDLSVGSETSDEENTTTNILVATRTDDVKFMLKVIVDQDKNYFLQCNYPSGDDVRTVSVPLNGICMLSFVEVTDADGKVLYTSDDGTKTADLDGKRVFECTVRCLVNNSSGGMNTTETTFVVATGRTK